MYQSKQQNSKYLKNISKSRAITDLVVTKTNTDWSQVKTVQIKVTKGEGVYSTMRKAKWESSAGLDAVIKGKLEEDYFTSDKNKFGLDENGIWTGSGSINVPMYSSYINYKNGNPDVGRKATKSSSLGEKYKKKMAIFKTVRKDKYGLNEADFSDKNFIINSKTTSETVNYAQLRKIQYRLREIYELRAVNVFFKNDLKDPGFNLGKSWKIQEKIKDKEALTDEDKKFINAEIKTTLTAIKDLQKRLKRDDFKMLNRIKTVYNLKVSYVNGQIKYGDPTYTFLKNYAVNDLKYETGEGTNKKTRTEHSHNFYLHVKNANIKKGILTNGQIKTQNKESEFKKVFKNDLKRSALMLAAETEGNFDAVNTWDGEKFSHGHIQFAGKSGMTKFLSDLKKNYATVFEKYFGEFGVNVIKNEITVYDYHNSNKILKGEKALTHMGKHLEYAMLFKASAWDVNVRKSQMESANDKWLKPAEDVKLSIPRLIISDKKGGEIKRIIGTDLINEYKKTKEYEVAEKADRINDEKHSLKAIDITTKKETRAALYMIGIHKPSYLTDKKLLQKAVSKTIKDHKITSVYELKTKYQKELLNEIIVALSDIKSTNEKIDILKKIHEKMI